MEVLLVELLRELLAPQEAEALLGLLRVGLLRVANVMITLVWLQS